MKYRIAAGLFILGFAAAAQISVGDLQAREARPARYYDELGQDRGYEWCFRRGRGGGSDCNYYTLRQCQATASGLLGYCFRNPYASGPQGRSERW